MSQSRDESPASSSPKPKSFSRHVSEDPEQRVRAYDDQPPPSLLKTYRDIRKPSLELPPGAQSPQSPGIRTSQAVAGLPVHSPLPPAPVSLIRSDTVLNRLFPNPSVRSKGGTSFQSGGTPSLESQRTHLPINGAPVVLPQSVDAGRAVEISPSTLAPTSPVTRNAHELHARLSYLPLPPAPIQPTQSRLDQSDTDFPPSPPPKSSLRPSHRRESSHFQARLAQAHDLPGTPETILIPTTTSPISTEDHSSQARSHQYGPPDSPTHRYSRSSRSYKTPEGDVSHSLPEAAAAPHIFIPQPVPSRPWNQPQSKGARSRTTVPVLHDNEPSPPLPPFSPDYHLYHIPDTRSPRSRTSEPLRH